MPPPPPPLPPRPPPEPANPAFLARYLLDKAAELDLEEGQGNSSGREGEGEKGKRKKGVRRYIVALAGIPGAGKVRPLLGFLSLPLPLPLSDGEWGAY